MTFDLTVLLYFAKQHKYAPGRRNIPPCFLNSYRKNSAGIQTPAILPFSLLILKKKWYRNRFRLEFLNRIIGPKISITADEMVMVTQPKYLSSIERLLRLTPKRVLANYMLMQTVLSSSAYLCKSARRPYHDFKYVLTGMWWCSDAWNFHVEMPFYQRKYRLTEFKILGFKCERMFGGFS